MPSPAWLRLIAMLAIVAYAVLAASHTASHEAGVFPASEPVYSSAKHAVAAAHFEASGSPVDRDCPVCLRLKDRYAGGERSLSETTLSLSGGQALPGFQRPRSATSDPLHPRAPPVV